MLFVAVVAVTDTNDATTRRLLWPMTIQANNQPQLLLAQPQLVLVAEQIVVWIDTKFKVVSELFYFSAGGNSKTPTPLR
jgi:hypothetical protein